MADNKCCIIPPFFLRKKLSSRHEICKERHSIHIQPKQEDTNINKSEDNKEMKGFRVCKSPGVETNFILMNELRNKISTFRDLLDFAPCNDSSSVNEMIKCSLKDLYSTYPQIRQTLLVSEVEAASILEVCDFFCIAIESLGDFWANGNKWKEKCKNKSCNKLDLDELEELALARLEDINKLARERMLDFMDEDEQQRGGCSPPSDTAFGRAISRSDSDDIKSFIPGSPDTPTSVLPLIPHISSDGIKINVSSRGLFSLRVQAIGKLNPIDVKRLSFHMFPHVAAQDPHITIQYIDPVMELNRVETIYDFVVQQPVKSKESNDGCSDVMLITPRVQAKETPDSEVKKYYMEPTITRLHPNVAEKDGPAPSPVALFSIPSEEDSQMSPRRPVSPDVLPESKQVTIQLKQPSPTISPSVSPDVMLTDTPRVQAKETPDSEVKKDDMEPTLKRLHSNVAENEGPGPGPAPSPTPVELFSIPSKEDTQFSPRSPGSPHVSPETKQMTIQLTQPSPTISSSVSPDVMLIDTPRVQAKETPDSEVKKDDMEPTLKRLHPNVAEKDGAGPGPVPAPVDLFSIPSKEDTQMSPRQPVSPHVSPETKQMTIQSKQPSPTISPSVSSDRLASTHAGLAGKRPPPPIGKGGPGAPPPPPPIGKGGPGAPPPPPPIGKGGPGAPPPPPGLAGGKNLRLKKAVTKLKRSSQMANLYRLLKGKVEGSCLTGKTQGRGKIGAPAGEKKGMADALLEMQKRSAYYIQIQEDIKNHAPVIREVKVAINSFETLDMAELIKFHKYVESHLEKLTDESQVLARFEDFPTKKLEALRMSAALYSKLDAIVQTLQNWQIVSPVNQVLDKFEIYFTKIKTELDALERTKDEEAKKFQSHKITFDFSVLIRIKELIVDVSSSCMELALKERREVKGKEMEENINPNKFSRGKKKNGSGTVMWKSFQFAYRVYSFAGGHDDRADMLTRELAQEIENDPDP